MWPQAGLKRRGHFFGRGWAGGGGVWGLGLGSGLGGFRVRISGLGFEYEG